MSAPSIADMRAALELGPDVSDAAVVDAYVASLGFAIAVEPTPVTRDPFVLAAAALFRAPGSAPASYVSVDGSAVECRAICSTSPVDLVIGNRTIEAGATLFQVERANFVIADIVPQKGGTIVIAETIWAILARPRLDVEGVSWLCEVATS